MLRPTCELCDWKGNPTYDLAEAKASCSDHQITEHFELVPTDGESS